MFTVMGSPSAFCLVLLLLPLQTPIERGFDALRQHRYQDALVAFEELVSVEPERAAAHYGKGLAFIGLLNYSAAVSSLEKAVSLSLYLPCAVFIKKYSRLNASSATR